VSSRNLRRDQAVNQRLRAAITALNPEAAPVARDSELRAIATDLLAKDDPSLTWLLIAAVTAELPTRLDVQHSQRTIEFDGAAAALKEIIAKARPDQLVRGLWAEVKVVSDAVLVDLHYTSRTELATGIQRVARQCARRWSEWHDITLIGWSATFRRIRQLTSPEVATALHGEPPVFVSTATGAREPVTIPWRCSYVMPELMTERPRALRLQAMIDYSNARSGVIGFDCVPLTSAETIGDAMGAAFAVNLTAVAQMDRIATISEAAATEYRGWRTMLGGAGLTGPDIRAISLAVESSVPSDDAVAEARRTLCVADLPMVFVVGSHEPRKNHLAVLQAAEYLWREGLEFSMAFVGGNAWNSERFTERLAGLRAAGRPVESISALSDEQLWAAYKVARFALFPSLNEGFGLPVAESIASGVPVITSGFGSMAEIAADGGALLVNPRDDRSIADAMRRLLTDDELHAELSAQARARTNKSWDTYAREVWDYLIAAEGGAEDGESR